jgi:lipopolysaccharide biosynthesis regulator YciM
MGTSKRGGARKGAGRKRGSVNPSTITKEQAREALRRVVLEHMYEMTAAQIAQAKGLKYLVTRDKKTGKFLRVTETMAKAKSGDDSNEETIEVWEKDPSVQAFTDLMNRAIDKPKEQEQDVNVNAEVVIKWADE